MKKTILAILLCSIAMLGLTGCRNDSLEDAKNDLNESYEKYGVVEEETVDTLVAKFNTEVVDNSSLNPASTDYVTTDSNRYWYGLYDGVSLVIIPKEFKNDSKIEIVDYMLIFVDKDSEYESNAIEYVKYLIKANNSNITDDEINTLLNEAKEKAVNKESANNGKGISVGYIENDDNYQYQVIRLYK